MEQTDSCRMGRGRWRLKEGEGISHRTYMKDPWTWMIERELIMEVGRGLGRGGLKQGKVGQL